MICFLIAAITALVASVTRMSGLQRKMRRVEKIACGGFLLALSGLLAKVAMADGAVTEDETETAEGFFSKMGLSRAERAMCVGNFRLAQRDPQPLREDAKALAATLNPVACQFLYGLLCRVAYADWRLSEGEERMLAEVGEALGLSDEVRALFHSGRFPALDRTALEASGVPPALVRLSRSGVDAGVKDEGLGIWDR